MRDIGIIKKRKNGMGKFSELVIDTQPKLVSKKKLEIRERKNDMSINKASTV